MQTHGLIKVLSFMLGLSGLIGCSDDTVQKDSELQQAVAYVRYLTRGKFLRKSALVDSYTAKKPSEFVHYLFEEFSFNP